MTQVVVQIVELELRHVIVVITGTSVMLRMTAHMTDTMWVSIMGLAALRLGRPSGIVTFLIRQDTGVMPLILLLMLHMLL
jgi:hypothetical protein